MTKYQAIRGTKDILPADSALFQKLEATARSVFHRFGFGEIRTPTFESLDLFQRSLGETTDVVQKEMYVFEDRGGRKLALRPEGTAGVVRAFVEHHLSQTHPFCKLFYIGPMFRAERPQAGRYREFWQAGAESFGNASPAADAEMLVLIQTLFRELGLKNVQLKLNSLGDPENRAAYVEALKLYLADKTAQLCEDCLRRKDQNPLRVLDCKIDGPKLTDVPQMDQFWSEAARRHFETVCALVKKAGGAFVLAPRLVRGLDYYTRTVFEFTSDALGAQDAIAAGGRYDRLVKEVGGPDTPALGFAMGVERTLESLKAQAGKEVVGTPNSLYIFVAALGEKPAESAFALLQQLRMEPGLVEKGVRVDGGFFEKKLGAQIQIADRIGASHCVILGEDELAQGVITVRALRTSSQEKVPLRDLVSHLRSFSGNA